MPSRTQIPNQVDWARLAAFIDGEGCISIDNKTCNKTAKRRTQLRIAVANTDPRLIEWLLCRFGGAVYRTGASGPRWSKCYRWQVTGPIAATILSGCRKFFIIKGDQADVGLSHQALCVRPGKLGHNPEVYVKRLRLRDELSMLKSPTARRKDLRPETQVIQ